MSISARLTTYFQTPRLLHTVVVLVCIGLLVGLFFGLSFDVSLADQNGDTDGLSWWKRAIVGVVQFIHILFNMVPAMFVFVTGMLFNFSVDLFVIKMGTLINVQSGIGFAINSLWGVIRDVMNMIFIFGLIYIGLKTIWNAEDSGTRKQLGSLIFAALIINFSLFIAKVVIDFTNILAVQIFRLITVSCGPRSDEFGTVSCGAGSESFTYWGFSGAFLDLVGVGQLLSNAKITGMIKGANGLIESFSRPIVYIFMTMIFLIILGIIFAAVSFMLIARFIALVIYMIFSPIMILGLALPAFAQYQKKWWDGFFKQAFFAPIFAFMFYMTMFTVEQLGGGLGGGDFASALDQQASNGAFNMVIIYAFAIGMLYASMVVAKNLSIAGAGTALSVIDKARKNAQGYIGRNSVGLAGDKLGKWMDRRGIGGKQSRWLNAATMGTLGTGTMRDTATSMKGAKFQSGVSRKDLGDKEDQENIRTAKAKQMNSIRSSVNAFTDNEGDDEKRKEMERKVQEAPSPHILEMVKNPKDRKLIKSVAGELTDGQWKAIMEDKEIDDDVKEELGKARSEQVADRLTRLNPKKDEDGNEIETNLEDVIHKADASELKAMGYDTAVKHAERLTTKQIKDWKDLTPTEKARLKAARKQKLEEEFQNGDNAQEIFNRFKSDAERAELSDKILTNPKSVEYLNPKVLSKLIDNDGVDAAVRDKIRDNIEKQMVIDGTHGPSPYEDGDSFTKGKLNDSQIKALRKFFDSPLGSQF